VPVPASVSTSGGDGAASGAPTVQMSAVRLALFAMKIDCHAHLICLSERSGGYMRLGWLRNLMKPIFARRLGIQSAKTPEDRDLLYAAVTASMIRESELDRAVVLAFDEVFRKDGERDEKHSYYYVPNNYCRDVCSRHPAEFLYGASVHPFRRDAIELLEKVREDGAVLVKLLPNSHGFDPSDKDLIPYYRKLKDLKLPLLVHAGYEHTIPILNQSFGNPERLRPALEEGVTVIVAHAGSAGLMHCKETFGAFLKLAREYPNCFGDTSALCNFWRAKYLKELLNPKNLENKYNVEMERPFDKLIHGSDFPIPITPRSFGKKHAKSARLKLPPTQNPLALDVALKREMGVPDECLTRAHDVLGIGRGSR
jgi:predicted TIM-barrel fold metal-dependent hydrolase